MGILGSNFFDITTAGDGDPRDHVLIRLDYRTNDALQIRAALAARAPFQTLNPPTPRLLVLKYFLYQLTHPRQYDKLRYQRSPYEAL